MKISVTVRKRYGFFFFSSVIFPLSLWFFWNLRYFPLYVIPLWKTPLFSVFRYFFLLPCQPLPVVAYTYLRSRKADQLHEKCPNIEFFLVRICPHSDWMRRDKEYLSVFSPNTGKYGLEKTPYLDTLNTDQKKHRIWILFTDWSF